MLVSHVGARIERQRASLRTTSYDFMQSQTSRSRSSRFQTVPSALEPILVVAYASHIVSYSPVLDRTIHICHHRPSALLSLQRYHCIIGKRYTMCHQSCQVERAYRRHIREYSSRVQALMLIDVSRFV
ncbi:hypothetical protein C8Q80DRAFT_844732 [Daedaleopsis nitida]|nr:hypothetical protein C8Q80DRAFT_844732 [Daedaleopsis nitida]